MAVSAFERPTRYVIEHTPRKRWEALHRVGNEPTHPEEFREYLDARTLKQARKECERLLEEWEFSQPHIHRRTNITAVSWDYSMEDVDDDTGTPRA